MLNNFRKVNPSILSADFGYLADEAKKIESSGANEIHIDIMDGHFVPNIALGIKSVAAINRATNLFLDVHIMVYNPYNFIEPLVQAGADRITFHFEATEDVEDTLSYIKKCGLEAGLAFCPDTSLSFIPKFLDKADLILLMTVNPGFGGQPFIPDVLEKVKFTRQVCDQLKLVKSSKVPVNGSQAYDIQVDGGINLETARACIEAGANILVSGDYLFKSPDFNKAVQTLKELT
ncbi:MAG: ribulose-phosphate 3-epimerase [Rhabdochlamydiaceae bacterium]